MIHSIIVVVVVVVVVIDVIIVGINVMMDVDPKAHQQKENGI